MLNIRHTGIYVEFYKKCFFMTIICENYQDSGPLFDDLLGYKEAKVLITKLITEMGKKNGTGDMLELIYVFPNEDKQRKCKRKICDVGMSHVAFGVSDIETTVQRIQNYGGKKITDIYTIGNKKCCFC